MSEKIVPRSLMPQIDEKDIGKLLVFAAKAGYDSRAGEAGVNLFVSHQKVDPVKVSKMGEKPHLLAKPVICTQTYEVIDGNHRVSAHRLNETLVPYIMIGCSFVQALDLLAVFPFAYELAETTPERN